MKLANTGGRKMMVVMGVLFLAATPRW
jgi:hypothetical protein